MPTFCLPLCLYVTNLNNPRYCNTICCEHCQRWAHTGLTLLPSSSSFAHVCMCTNTCLCLQIGHDLEATVTTQFATFHRCFVSLLRCRPALKSVVGMPARPGMDSGTKPDLAAKAHKSLQRISAATSSGRMCKTLRLCGSPLLTRGPYIAVVVAALLLLICLLEICVYAYV